MNSQTIGTLTPEGSLVFRVVKTCYKMLRKRGYFVSEEVYNMSSDVFRSTYGEVPDRSTITIECCKRNDPDDQIIVFFAAGDKVTKEQIGLFTTRMMQGNIRRALLIVKAQLTSSARNALKVLISSGIRIEVFMDKELLVDITEHKHVPSHVLLTPQEKVELLHRYRLKETQLPRIQSTDPVARYLGLKLRDVVKIERDSETAGRYITYRICY